MMRRFLAGVAVVAAVALAAPAGALAYAGGVWSPSREATWSVPFGQAPVFVPHTRPQLVLYGKDFKTGSKNQVYVERLDGVGGPRCLTCTDVPQSGDPASGNPSGRDPNNINGVPAVSPDGDWVIFHSWRNHYMTIGSPGYGGMGSALWAMNVGAWVRACGRVMLKDCTVPLPGQYRLTPVDPQSNFSGEGYDDYHAYWSPDGTHIEYAHLNWNFVTGGGSGKWDVRVARFNPVCPSASGHPCLTEDHEVRPYNGHWYETQWWNPNPRTPGFLYTESYPERASGGGASVPQLFYCTLPSLDSGSCTVTRITDNASWDEQAIFTPDGGKVIFMSSRARDGLFNTWANLTRTAAVPSDYDYLLILPIFEAGFLQPVGQEATDLYETSLKRPGTVTRLTHDGDNGWITPEFAWDPSRQYLMWTENRFPDGYRYQTPDGPAGWAQQLQDLAADPPNASDIIDVNNNGVGVAPLPLQQQTQILCFKAHACPLAPK